MAEKKRKTRETSNRRKGKTDNNKKKGLRLPSSLRRQVDSLNPKPNNTDSSDEETELTDFYEVEETLPEEELHKNRRYDSVDNLEYKLPDEFEDEDLSSDKSDDSDDDDDQDDNHKRMLQGITGMPAEAFEHNNKKSKFVVVSEAHPESEYNPIPHDGESQISIKDLLNSLQQKKGNSDIRNRIQKLEKKAVLVQTPLSKALRENVERKVAYEHSKKDITKWEPLVKRNREASTIFFDEDTDIGFSTVAAIANDFQPRTEFEKAIDSLVHDEKLVEAYNEDGARLLELNKVSVEDVKDRQNRLAKMRSLLFRHEMKAKHVKKIKSKTYHRLQKKTKEMTANAEMMTDPEAAKEQKIKQEFKRAEERLTLKHKHHNKWAKRILERGLTSQDEGTRVAVSQQLHTHEELTRKQNSMYESSSSAESSDDDDELFPGTEQDGASKLLANAKEKTIKAMEMEDEMPASGVLSLPFMVRGMKKRKDEAYAEAQLALEEYELSLKQLEEAHGAETPEAGTLSGRRVFGAIQKHLEESENRTKSKHTDSDSDSDSEHEYKAKDNVDMKRAGNRDSQEVHVDANMFDGESDFGRELVFKNFDDTNSNPGPKTQYNVAIFASNSWKKMECKNIEENKERDSPAAVEPPVAPKDLKEVYDGEDTESEEEMVDGILSGNKPVYELPSQEELIRRAFAGDDVEEDFAKDKEKVLDEENPEPEKPVLVPGWGQWTRMQQKKGMPSWMVKEHENAKKKRDDSLKKRKDAHLKHVIISEKVIKKADKLHTKTLPFPFTSKEMFEQSMRVPLGPEFNPATSVGALIRPDVMKKPGVIIKPIMFEEVNPHEKEDGHKSKGKDKKIIINKNNRGRPTKKMKTKHKS